MRVFLTGISGLAGAAIARGLVVGGHEVVALARQPLARQPLGREWIGIEPLAGDLETLKSLPEGTGAVVHAAARHSRRRHNAVDFARANVQGTANLLSAAKAHGVGTVIFLSSLSIYGRIDKPVLTEDVPSIDPDAYGLSKLLCERMLDEAAPGLRSVALRLPAILGPGATDHWLSGVVTKAMAGESIRIFNPEAPFNNAVHRDDLAAFIVSLLEKEWSGAVALNIACTAPMTVGTVAARIVDAAGGRSEIRVEERDAVSFTISTDRAERSFGFTPRPFAETLDRYLGEAIR